MAASTWIRGFVSKKGIFIDGHEREDVVAYRKEFLHQMMEIGFLHFTEALMILTHLQKKGDQKMCFFFHDETTFNANEDLSMNGRESDEAKEQGGWYYALRFHR